MGDLTKNFSRSEFECKGRDCCGHSYPVDRAFVEGLQALRDAVSKHRGRDTALTITSGFRCRRHNSEIGGSKNSFHCLGMAADIDIPAGMTPDDLAAIAETIPMFRE